MNSLIGKFCQRSKYPSTEYVTDSDQIDNILASGREITNFTTISPYLCELEIDETKTNTRKLLNRKANPILTAFVTAFSRIDMHQYIISLSKANFLPMYTDTDSLIFCGPETTPLPLPISQKLGDFKHEYKKVLTGFCCIGKKNYAISMKEGSTEKEICDYKVRGLSLKSHECRSKLSFSDFEDFLRRKTETMDVRIPQSRLQKNKNSSSITKKIVNVRLATKLNFSRILTQTEHFQTVPYGYISPK